MGITNLTGRRVRAVWLTGLCGGLVVLAAACGSSSKASSGTATTGAATAPAASAAAGDAGTTAYVANVCKAVKQLSDSMGTFRGPGGSGTPGASATPGATVTPDATARAKALQDAGSTFVAALLASNPPAALQAYNAQVADAVNTAITNISSGNFGRGGGFAGTPRSGTPRSGTPRARPSGAAQGTPSGTRPAGGRGGGAALFLRNIPAPPAASAAALKLAASQDTNCQAAGFTFGQ